MFFVAESITEDPEEFRAALAGLTGALKPGSPFATAFMAGSNGYPAAGTHFPALPITPRRRSAAPHRTRCQRAEC
jgi:hypothetical protein